MSKLDTALARFKREYSPHVRVGEKAIDVSSCFQRSPSRVLKTSASRGMRVYALPIFGGAGMFVKWKLTPSGKLHRDSGGKPVINRGFRQLVAACVCTAKAKNIGSDELLVKGEDSMEGVKRDEALLVFSTLKINPSHDSYVLFIRSPQKIASAVEEFTTNLNGILRQGRRWSPSHYLGKIHLDERSFREIVGRTASKIHPLVRGAMLERVFRSPLSGSRDPFVRNQFLPHIRKAARAGKSKIGKRSA